MYEIFFELEVNLCDRFPGLTPFSVRKERASEVFLLTRRLNGLQERQSKDADKNISHKGKTVIRRPASDTWF